MTVNDEMVLILRYFTEFASFRDVLHKSGWQNHNYGQFTITMSSIINVCRGTARRPRYKYCMTAWWKFCSRFINSRLNAQYLLSHRLICQTMYRFSFWYFEARVRYRRKAVHVRYLISWWVLVFQLMLSWLVSIDRQYLFFCHDISYNGVLFYSFYSQSFYRHTVSSLARVPV